MTPTEQKQADEQDALMSSLTLDDLGIKDMEPATDYFMEAGELLREANVFLRNLATWTGSCSPTDVCGDLSEVTQDVQEFASRIEKFLKDGVNNQE
jgi:hypothetical protein